MAELKIVTVEPNLSQLTKILTRALITMTLATTVLVFCLSRLLHMFGVKWYPSLVNVAIIMGIVVATICGITYLTALLRHRPRLEIGSDGFISYSLLGQNVRRWTDIEGGFAVITIGLSTAVAYRLKQEVKDAQRIKSKKAFGGNDECISGAFLISADEIADLLNEYLHPRNVTSQSV